MTLQAGQVTDRLASSETGMENWLCLPLVRMLAASPAVAEPWTKSHPGGTVIPVAEAYRLASSLAEKMLRPDSAPTSHDAGHGTPCC